MFDYVTHAHRSPTPEKKKEEEDDLSLSRVARGSVRRSRKKRGSALDTHTHTQREEKTRLSFSFSLSLFIVVLSGDPSKFPLRFWRLDFVFVFVVCVVVCVVSFRFDDMWRRAAFLRFFGTKKPKGGGEMMEVLKDVRKLAETMKQSGRRGDAQQQHPIGERSTNNTTTSAARERIVSGSSASSSTTTTTASETGGAFFARRKETTTKTTKTQNTNAQNAFDRIERARKTLNEYWSSFSSSKGGGGRRRTGAHHHRHPRREMEEARAPAAEEEVTSRSSFGGSGGYFFNPYWQKTEQVIDYASIDAVARVYKKPPNPISSLRHAGVKFPNVLFHPATLRWYKEYWMCLYEKVFLEKPFLAALATSVFKCVSSDAFVQIFVEGNTHLDYQRVGCFFALGVAYVGAFQYSLYNHMLKPLYGVMKPKLGIPGATGAIVAADQLFVAPFVYLPTFLAIKMWSENKTTAGEFYGTLKTLWNDTVFETMRALWIVWVPAQMFNFWVVPRHLTIPFMNVVGFGWNGILSFVHGQRKILDAKEREEAKMFVEKMQPLLSGSKDAHPPAITIANARVATNQTSNLNTVKRLTTSEGEEKKEEVPLIAGLIDSQQPTVDEEGTENEPREQDMEH